MILLVVWALATIWGAAYFVTDLVPHHEWAIGAGSIIVATSFIALFARVAELWVADGSAEKLEDLCK